MKAVIRLIGDVLDDWLQTALPPYKAAVVICGQATELGLVDCEGKRLEVRDSLLRELLTATGVYQMIRQALKIWRAIPAEIRENFGTALAVGGSVVAFFEDPSLDKAWQTISTTAEQTIAYVAPILQDIWNGNLPSVPFNAYLDKYLGIDVDAVLDTLVEYGYTKVDEASDQLRASLKNELGEVGGALAAWAVNPVGEAVSLAGDVVSGVKDVVEDVGEAVSSLNPF